MIQPGDILLFKGNTPIISAAIRWFTQSEYTHVGIATKEGWVYEIDINRQLAIHPIRSMDYDVYRYKEGLTILQKTQLQVYAAERAEQSQGYDWRKIVSMFFGRCLKLPLRWNHQHREICSEIVDYLYANIGIELVPTQPLGHVTPADIAASSQLIKVFSHKASHK